MVLDLLKLAQAVKIDARNSGKYHYFSESGGDVPLDMKTPAELAQMLENVTSNDDPIQLLLLYNNLQVAKSIKDRVNFYINSLRLIYSSVKEFRPAIDAAFKSYKESVEPKTQKQDPSLQSQISLRIDLQKSTDQQLQQKTHFIGKQSLAKMRRIYDQIAKKVIAARQISAFQDYAASQKLLDLKKYNYLLRTSFIGRVDEKKKYQVGYRLFKKHSERGVLDFDSFLKLVRGFVRQCGLGQCQDEELIQMMDCNSVLKKKTKTDHSEEVYRSTPHSGKLPEQIREELELRKQQRRRVLELPKIMSTIQSRAAFK